MMTSLTISAPDLSVLDRAQALLGVDDPVALEIYFLGHRAGAAAERASLELTLLPMGHHLNACGPLPRPLMTRAELDEVLVTYTPKIHEGAE